MTAREEAPLPVLYLDFDGVLHADDVGRDWYGRPYMRGQGSLFDYTNRLIAALEPYPAQKIVLSTNWVRSLGFSHAQKWLPQELRERVIGATWHSRSGTNDISRAWWIYLSTRFQQIAEDVGRRKPSHWFALDNDARGWPYYARMHLIQCDSQLGLSEPRTRLLLEAKLANPPRWQADMRASAATALFLEPGSTLVSLARVADCLQVDPLDLMSDAGVDRDAAEAAQSRVVQDYLCALLKALAAAMEVFEHQTQAIAWMKDQPLKTFRGKTAYQLVKEGRAADVVRYLESVATGFVG